MKGVERNGSGGRHTGARGCAVRVRRPLTPAVLSQALDVDRRTVDDLCARLQSELAERSSGLVLRNVAGGWRLFTDPETQPIVERFVLSSRQARMTKAALETLAIVAYKQPVTRHQVSAIRGVNADGVLRALVDRGLIEEAGRDEGPGASAPVRHDPGVPRAAGPRVAGGAAVARAAAGRVCWSARRRRPRGRSRGRAG